ncbi:efflux RND transporter permease subunit [Methylococcus geothermalis]|uniref:CusA/CzcA family heavy metal efflux RND transporter n=1 Tax=Methylococcus geothermalis TaxID=2681310 RepID=A0A858Q8W2_9GAMM|nr:CusA/CzcA family heavy metal efflux RND transporter [Methylococcus geothermalis]QJD30235.1 CusA/CzcA family heavy metal efflux RND transporter [Methylococcus geothermalis]
MIESLIRTALRQRLIVVIVTLCLLAFGLTAMRELSVDAFPDVTNVQVQVAAEAPGRSPEEVERFVTVPLEIAMTGLPGLTEMRSVNRNALSQINLVFTDDTDVYFARQLVLERLIEAASQLPDGITPVLGPVSTGLGEVYQFTLERPDDGDRALTEQELTERRTVQDWVVRPLLRGVPGVAEINSIGGYERQYQVLANPDRLRHYGISLKDIYTALALNNANSGGGKLPRYAEQYLIRGLGLIENIEDIRNIVLKESGGTPVFIRDVAEVKIGHAVRYGAVIKNGQTEAVGGIVMMIRGGNAKRIVTELKERIQEINDKGMLPGGLKIVPYYDRTTLVDAAIHTVTKVLVEGIVLVIVILLLYLGDVRSSLIVVATLVITPLVTFMVMNRYGISANLMSLGGLAIAIGIMVDGSVVVVENTFRHLGEMRDTGETKLQVVLHAAAEVGTPVLFGVGIICLVFLPLMTMTGLEGKLFAPLAYTIAIALFISLIVSLTLSPVLCAYLLKGGGEQDTRIIAAMKRPYLALLSVALCRPRTVVVTALALLALSLGLFPLLGTSFIPEMKEGAIVTGINRAPSMSLDESIKMETEAMRLVMQVPGIARAVSQLGRSQNPTDTQPENESTPILTLKPQEELPPGWDQDDVMDALSETLRVLPGVQVVMAQPISDRVDEMITGVRSDIAIKIFGDELEVLKRKGDEIVRVLRSVRGASDIRMERISGQQYLTIDIDRWAIARHGINVQDINDIIETAIGGRESTQIYEGERRFQAVVRFPDAFRGSGEAIGKIMLESHHGALVPLEHLAEIRLTDGPAQISREMAKRRLVIGANVRGRDLGGFVAELQKAVGEKVKLPEGYFLKWGGQFENLERAMNRLLVIIPITIAAIFFLLFLLFQSLRFAGLIILVLPFASMGGIFSLFASGEYLSVPASVGFITLWGIAVLNGVVLVSRIRGLRETGIDRETAIVEGCTQRFRPVMMTATVAMLGLVPFLFSNGPGSEVQRPLAIVVIGGLITSTLLTLVVLPTLYQWFEDRSSP